MPAQRKLADRTFGARPAFGKGWIVSNHYGLLPGLIENSHLHDRIPLALSRGPDFLLYCALDLVVDSYFPLLDEIEDEIDSLEDRLLARPAMEINRLLTLKRSLVRIRRAVSPQREVFNQVTRHDFRHPHGVPSVFPRRL